MEQKKKVTKCRKKLCAAIYKSQKKEIEKYLVSILAIVASVQCKNNKLIEHAKKDAEPYK